ncbi:MAG: hypothetical protein MN733_11815 [Nitrososphaera sp.]|nr:hypothetical protein [Nitrososphaera sp.]
MEMLAIYFALADNKRDIGRIASAQRKNKELVITVRSDSKTSVEQLQGVSEVRDAIIRRICGAIRQLLNSMSLVIIFNHLERARNIAGLLLEQRRRKQEEQLLMHLYQKNYDGSELKGFFPGPYESASA